LPWQALPGLLGTVAKLPHHAIFLFHFSYLFCVRKLAVKRRLASLCYPMGMEMFLLVTVAALLTVIFIDTGRKRRAYLCQQVKVTTRD
jgi:hypothetical protein